MKDYDYNKLLHDFRRIAELVPILRDEKKQKQRNRLAQLFLEELQKIEDDVEEINKEDINNGNV